MYFRICFPSGIFYGSEAYNPSLAEWPPHPSRLFSALVASAYRSGDGINEQKIKALKWLESLSPPEMYVPFAETPEAPVSFVPTGDITGRKGKKGEEQYEHGIHRWRQPRHFPQAIIMDKPEVYYQWAEDPPNDEILSTLDDMAFDVTHVGTSHSMAVVKPYAGEMPLSATLIPNKTGDQYLRVPSEGRLDELDVIFENTTGVRRPPSSCDPFIPYRKKRAIKTHQSNRDFLTVRISDSMHGADTAYYVGKSLRAAVMSVLGDEAPACVHGHNSDQHIGWLPLPEVGHKYSKGRIIGFGVSIPWEVSSEEKEKILSGIGRLKNLKLPDGRVASITQIMPGEKTPVSLSKKTWTKPSKVWASVTPVILDRAPKKLTEKRVVKAMKQSFVFAGYPEPVHITPSKFSIFDGAPPIFQVPIKKPRYHAVVEFENPVSGPVVAGRMRYFGIGLFRPVYPS